MKKYKMIKYLYIDNITGQEKNAMHYALEQSTYTRNDIVDLILMGYECCTLSNVLIRLSKEICVGASRITKYVLFKEV